MKRLAYIAAVLLGIYFMVSLFQSLTSLLSQRGNIEKAEETLALEKKKHEELILKTEYVESAAFIEREAREKLLLGKPGETRVIIDEKLLFETLGTAGAELQRDIRPNWQKWLELFFKY